MIADTPSAEDLVFRAQMAWEERDRWRSVLDEAYEYGLPDRNPYVGDKKNPRLRAHLFDSTAPNAVMRGANRLLLDLTPPDQYWIDLKPGPFIPEQVKKQIALLLEGVGKILNIIFQSGSFISAIHELYLDLLVGGLGAMLVLESDESLTEVASFVTVSQAEISIETGPDGNVCGIYRKPCMKPRNIMRQWPDAKNIPDELMKLIKDAKQTKEVELLEVTYYSKHKGRPIWHYEVFWTKEGKDPQKIVDREYDTCPWIVPRWFKIPGSTYGPSLIMMALPDIKTANKVVEMTLMNAAIAVAGMYTVVDDGVVNPAMIQIRPGGLIPVKSNAGPMGASIQALPVGRGFDVGQVVLDDLRMSIRKTMLDHGLPPENSGVRSATEIIERMREIAQDLGGAFGRLMSELIVPLVRRVVDILYKRGMIPEVKVDQFAVKVQINSPLARTQQMQDVQKVVQFLEIAARLAGPNAPLIAGKIEEILPWIAEQLGVPARLLREEGEMKQLFLQLMQAAANQNMPERSAESGLIPSQQREAA